MSEEKWIVFGFFGRKTIVYIDQSTRWTEDLSSAKEFTLVEAIKYRDVVACGSLIDIHPRCRYE